MIPNERYKYFSKRSSSTFLSSRFHERKRVGFSIGILFFNAFCLRTIWSSTCCYSASHEHYRIRNCTECAKYKPSWAGDDTLASFFNIRLFWFSLARPVLCSRTISICIWINLYAAVVYTHLKIKYSSNDELETEPIVITKYRKIWTIRSWKPFSSSTIYGR